MVKIVHISDLHIGEPGARKAFDKLLTAIHDNEPEAHVVLTGDGVNDGHERQYRQLDGILKKHKYLLETPKRRHYRNFRFAPGNHDFGTLGNFFLPEARKRFYDRFWPRGLRPYVLGNAQGAPVVLVTLDSADGRDEEWFARGRLGAGQLRKLDAILTRLKDFGAHVVLSMHHHPFLRGEWWEENHYLALTDSDRFLQTVKERADVLLFGHKHHDEFWEHRFGFKLIHAAGKSVRDRQYTLIEIGETIHHEVVKID